MFSKKEAVEFIERFGALMNFLIPLYGRKVNPTLRSPSDAPVASIAPWP